MKDNYLLSIKQNCLQGLYTPLQIKKDHTSFKLMNLGAYEYLVKIYEGQLSVHNQTKLLAGSIYPPENSKSTELPTVQFLSDNFLKYIFQI